jgi:hypothetical protein
VLALPGTYKVSLWKRVNNGTTKLTDEQTFTAAVLGTASLPPAERKELLAFQSKVGELQRAVAGASRLVNEMKSRMALIKKSLADAANAPPRLRDDARSIELRILEIQHALGGNTHIRQRNEPDPPSISERVQGIIDDQWLSTSAPTQTHLKAYEIASEAFTPLLARLRTLVEAELKALEAAMEDAKAPWTPGRVPDWKAR